MTERDQLTDLRRSCARINAEAQTEAPYSGMEHLYAAVDAIVRLVDVLAEHAQQSQAVRMPPVQDRRPGDGD